MSMGFIAAARKYTTSQKRLGFLQLMVQSSWPVCGIINTSYTKEGSFL